MGCPAVSNPPVLVITRSDLDPVERSSAADSSTGPEHDAQCKSRPNQPSGSLRTHAGTSESGLIGEFLGGVFGRHLIGWLTKHAYDNGSKQCADNSMNAVCA